MDRPNTPSRPPDYSMHSYDDDHDTPSGTNSAAIRLLTSVESPIDESRPYVSMNRAIALPPPASPCPSQFWPAARQKSVTVSSSGLRRQDQDPYCPTRANQALPQSQPQTHVLSVSKIPIRPNIAKLQKKPNINFSNTQLPVSMSPAKLPQALPKLPDGPSERFHLQRAGSNAALPPKISPSFQSSSPTRSPPKLQRANGDATLPSPASPNSKVIPISKTLPNSSATNWYSRYSNSSTFNETFNDSSSRQSYQAYQPSVTSSPSRESSIKGDTRAMPPPDSTYVPFSNRDSGSPQRPWTPSSRISEFSRPPPTNLSFEPSDLNGSPRPGTPSSKYGGSPRRPLPPAPLFSNSARNSQAFADDATVNIPLDGGDDVFGPGSDLSDSRPLPTTRDSFHSESQETLNENETEEEYYEKVDRYGPAPDGAQERRGVRAPQMSRKEVVLINGELVLECKIPTILYSFLPRRDEVEFTHMRYTAVTCDPDDFVERGYKLRQSIGRTTRETELFICITMYNEDEIGFTRTMHAVMKNISHFCSRSRSRTWGETGWQKIVVCIICDGRPKIHPRTLDALAAMGVFQHGIAKNFVNNRAVQAHVYEYTTQVSLDSDLKFKGAEKGIVPCQMIFCLKEKNRGKLNSHRWFFNAFGRALNPNICILLDVGTRPGGNSLYHLWKAFDTDSNVAGACGEIKAMKGKYGSSLLNPLVASQNFEYKMSNILDKPLESVFGYITVLPGALSAYRYHALQNDEHGHGPLSQYFKGETLHGQHADVFTANMYLAEDRILCWELVAKRGERWVLKYVKGCTGETDVPGRLQSILFEILLLTQFRFCSRIHLPTSKMAQWCILCCCLLSRQL